MPSHRFTVDCDWVREMLEDLIEPFRSAFVLKTLPLVEAELQEVCELLHPIKQAFRRACAPLENTELSPATVPAIRPGLESRHKAATCGHYAAMCLDFFVGLGNSRLAFHLSWVWSLAVGILFVLLAVLSRIVAAIFLNRNRPVRYIPFALVLGASGWLVIVLCFAGLVAVRNGLIDIGALNLISPMLWLGFLAQSVAFGVLAEIYGYPIALFHRHRQLVMRGAELASVRQLLVSQPLPDSTPQGLASNAGSRISADPGQGNLKPVPPLRAHSIVSQALGVIALLSLSVLAIGRAHAEQIESRGISRTVLAPDESPGSEDTDEFLRVRRVLGDGLEAIVGALPRPKSVVILHWSDASSVWAAGKLFLLPGETRELPAEAKLAPFAFAVSVRQASDDAQDRATRAPVLERVRRELMARPGREASQSCTTQLVCRAVEAPASDLWIIVSDLKDFHCDPMPSCVPGGARVCIVAIPQDEGAETWQRLFERITRVRNAFSGLVIVPSWEIDSPSSLRDLVRRVAPQVSQAASGR